MGLTGPPPQRGAGGAHGAPHHKAKAEPAPAVVAALAVDKVGERAMPFE